jgi:hypothetical protein
VRTVKRQTPPCHSDPCIQLPQEKKGEGKKGGHRHPHRTLPILPIQARQAQEELERERSTWDAERAAWAEERSAAAAAAADLHREHAVLVAAAAQCNDQLQVRCSTRLSALAPTGERLSPTDTWLISLSIRVHINASPAPPWSLSDTVAETAPSASRSGIVYPEWRPLVASGVDR